MKQYLDLVNEVLKRGTRKENRTGVDTISAFNINYSIDLNEGFPLLTTKEISWKNIVVENLWFLSGEGICRHPQASLNLGFCERRQPHPVWAFKILKRNEVGWARSQRPGAGS